MTALTRRSMMATVAALPVAALPTVADASADAEVFRLVRAAHAGHDVLDSIIDGDPDEDEQGELGCDMVSVALYALAAVPAVTTAGVLAKVRLALRDPDFDYIPLQHMVGSLLRDIAAMEGQS